MKFEILLQRTIRQKLTIGFGIVMGLILVQGIVSCILLFKQNDDQNRLATSYIPSANAVSQLERIWNEVEYNMDLFNRSMDNYYATRSTNNILRLCHQYDEFSELMKNDKDILIQNGIDMDYIGTLVAEYQVASTNHIESQTKANEEFEVVQRAYKKLNSLNGSDFAATRHYYELYSRLMYMIQSREFFEIEKFNNKVESLSAVADYAGLPDNVQDAYSYACESMNIFCGSFRDCRRTELKQKEIGGNLKVEISSATDIGLDLISAMGDRTSNFIEMLTDVTLIITILVVVISVIIIITLSRSIIVPINQCIAQTERLAAGDLSVTFEDSTKDEIGRLQSSLNLMVTNLRRIVLEIKKSSHTLNESCKSLQNGAADLAEGASEQATAAEEVAASMEKISENIRQAAAESHDTGLIATHTSETIIQSKEVSEKANEYVADIIKKIAAIGNIATQTNILALNANVEAARAGSEGKGFAVVANAVRNLANQTQDIANRISESSSKTYQTANEAMRMIADITPEIQRTAKLVMNISMSSNEQVVSVDQINDAMRQLNDVTQRNAASADAISYETNKLKNMSNDLQNAVSEFYGVDE